MFKVSFIEKEMLPTRVVMKAGLGTIVTLKGRMEIPHFWHRMPEEIQEWVAGQTKIELYEDVAHGEITVFTEGMAKCRKDDRYDSLLGERLAESRAKQHIYRFFKNLTAKLEKYYQEILFGGENKVVNDTKHGIVGCNKKYQRLLEREENHFKELIDSKNHE